jgi:hypothetical protein
MPSKVGWRPDPGKRLVAALLVLALDTLRLSVHRMGTFSRFAFAADELCNEVRRIEPFLRAITAPALVGKQSSTSLVLMLSVNTISSCPLRWG